MNDMLLEELAAQITRCAEGRTRILVAICGAPGSGKSTLAADLAAAIGPSAAVLPMDGFHLDNATLRARGLLQRKGAAETFDAQGFVALARRVLAERSVFYPGFDRAQDCTIPDAGQISAQTRIVLAEGNYLLLNQRPWSDLAPLFTLTIMLDVPRAVLAERLIARWRDHGMPIAAATARAQENDLPNADFVISQSRAADIVLTQNPT